MTTAEQIWEQVCQQIWERVLAQPLGGEYMDEQMIQHVLVRDRARSSPHVVPPVWRQASWQVCQQVKLTVEDKL
jgi:hypothetical protein